MDVPHPPRAVLLCIAQDSGIRLREIGERVGITERAAHRIVGELADAGYLSRERHGRRNRYTINSDLTLPDPVARAQRASATCSPYSPRGEWPSPG